MAAGWSWLHYGRALRLYHQLLPPSTLIGYQSVCNTELNAVEFFFKFAPSGIDFQKLNLILSKVKLVWILIRNQRFTSVKKNASKYAIQKRYSTLVFKTPKCTQQKISLSWIFIIQTKCGFRLKDIKLRGVIRTWKLRRTFYLAYTWSGSPSFCVY